MCWAQARPGPALCRVWLPRGLRPLGTHCAVPGSMCTRGTAVALTAREPQVSHPDGLRMHLGLAFSLSVPPPGLRTLTHDTKVSPVPGFCGFGSGVCSAGVCR